MEPPYGAHINQIIESNKQIIYLQIERCKNMLTMSCFSLVYLVAVFRLLQVADFSISAFCALGHGARRIKEGNLDIFGDQDLKYCE